MAKYLKQDCEIGYIDDNAEIEYTQFCNLRHTILGCMLGDYDSQGRYVVSPEIVDELIRMPKYIVDSMDNIEVCASELKLDKQLTFLVTFESDRVTLSLMEKISFESNIKLNSGTYSNINEYILDEIETSGVVNKNTIYSMWNIKEFGGTALDVFNMDEKTLAVYFNIVNRFKYLMTANKILLENEHKLEEIESNYANRMLDILNSYPKLKAKVEKEIKATLEEKKDFIKIDKPNFAKTMNEIIEKAIDNNLDVLNPKEKESFKQEKHQAQMETNILRREVIEITPKPVEVVKENLNNNNFEFDNSDSPVVPVIATNGEAIRSVNEVAASFAETRARVAEEVKSAAETSVEQIDNKKVEASNSNAEVPAAANNQRENGENQLADLVARIVGMGVSASTLTTPPENNQKRGTAAGISADSTKKVDGENVAPVNNVTPVTAVPSAGANATGNAGTNRQERRITTPAGGGRAAASVGGAAGGGRTGAGTVAPPTETTTDDKKDAAETRIELFNFLSSDSPFTDNTSAVVGANDTDDYERDPDAKAPVGRAAGDEDGHGTDVAPNNPQRRIMVEFMPRDIIEEEQEAVEGVNAVVVENQNLTGVRTMQEGISAARINIEHVAAHVVSAQKGKLEENTLGELEGNTLGVK